MSKREGCVQALRMDAWGNGFGRRFDDDQRRRWEDDVMHWGCEGAVHSLSQTPMQGVAACFIYGRVCTQYKRNSRCERALRQNALRV